MSWYRAGSVAVTNGNPNVVGTGTDFVSNTKIGDAFQGPDGRSYEINQIVSATVMILASSYQGATASGQAYAVQPTSSFANDLALQVSSLIVSYANVRDGIGQGLFPDGTVTAPAFRFSSDQSTGFYKFGNGSVGVSASGVARWVFATNNLAYANANGDVLYAIARAADATANVSFVNNAQTAQLGSIGSLPGSGGFRLGSPGNLTLDAGAGAYVILSANGTPSLYAQPTRLVPVTDAAYDLGYTSVRYNNIYSVNGVTTSSDQRLKKWRGALTADELSAAKEIASNIGIYQMLDAIAAKGADVARLHAGVLAQQLITTMSNHGLDAARYGFLCHDAWEAAPAQPAIPPRAAVFDDEGKIVTPAMPGVAAVPARAAGDLYSVRYQELSMFLLVAQENRLAALEAKASA